MKDVYKTPDANSAIDIYYKVIPTEGECSIPKPNAKDLKKREYLK